MGNYTGKTKKHFSPNLTKSNQTENPNGEKNKKNLKDINSTKKNTDNSSKKDKIKVDNDKKGFGFAKNKKDIIKPKVRLTFNHTYNALNDIFMLDYWKLFRLSKETSSKYYSKIQQYEKILNSIYVNYLIKKYKWQKDHENAKKLAKAISNYKIHKYNANLERVINDVYKRNLSYRYELNSLNKNAIKKEKNYHKKDLDRNYKNIKGHPKSESAVTFLIDEEKKSSEDITVTKNHSNASPTTNFKIDEDQSYDHTRDLLNSLNNDDKSALSTYHRNIDNYNNEEIRIKPLDNDEMESSILSKRVNSYDKPTTNLKEENIINHVNYLEDDNSIKANYDKESIDFVIKPNAVLKDIALTIHKESRDDIDNLAHIIQFTNLTQQGFLAEKHSNSDDNKVSLAKQYNRSLEMILNNDNSKSKALGLEMLIKSVEDAKIYEKDELPKATELINGTANFNTDAKKQINAVYKTLRDERANEIWMNTFLRDNLENHATEILKNFNGDNVTIHKEDILFSNPNSNYIPQGVYEFHHHGKGIVTGENYVELKEVNSGKYNRIYGSTIDDISNKLGDNLLPSLINTADEEIKHLIKNQANETVANNIMKSFIEESMIDYTTFKKNSIESDVFNTLFSMNNSDKINIEEIINNSIEKHNVNSDSLKKELISLNNTLSYNEKLGRAQAHSKFFNTPNGNLVKEMSNIMSILEKKQMVKKDLIGDFIKQFNENIKDKSINPMEIRDNIIIDNVPKPHTNRNAVISDILKKAENISYPLLETMTGENENVSEVIHEINNEKMFNIIGVENQLLDHLKSKTISPELIAKYGSEQALEYGKYAFVQKPLQDLIEHQTKTQKRMEEYYNFLAHDDSEQSRNFLNWNILPEPTESINSDLNNHVKDLGESKIAFGNFVGAKLNEVSIKDLKEIHKTNLNVDKGNIYTSSINGTKKRIDMYFEAIDNLGSKLDNSIVNRETNILSHGLLNEEDLLNLGDINDSIKGVTEPVVKPSITLKNKKLSHSENLIEDMMSWNTSIMAKSVEEGISLGLASSTSDIQYVLPISPLKPEIKPKGMISSEINDGYDESITSPRIAPPSESPVKLSGNTGIKYNISAKSDGSVPTSSITDAIQKIVRSHSNAGPNLNVSLNTQNDHSSISDQWLKGRVKNLIK